ncbi:MAG TPA: N-acetyltransferase family protein [Spirochaetota bacterium]|nr:N-acetyltransferase family protein [Spirochaetota bacterium]
MLAIRQAEEQDARQIAEIYNHYIRHTKITFETESVTIEEMAERIRGKISRYDWFVAEDNGVITGYAYYGEFRGRAAYHHTVESTVYVAESMMRMGIGSALYDRLIKSAGNKGFREMIAVIALPNEGSVVLHGKKGFNEVGVFRGIGCKFGEYIDVIFMQKSLY